LGMCHFILRRRCEMASTLAEKIRMSGMAPRYLEVELQIPT
jgi:hypothetical protein